MNHIWILDLSVAEKKSRLLQMPQNPLNSVEHLKRTGLNDLVTLKYRIVRIFSHIFQYFPYFPNISQYFPIFPGNLYQSVPVTTTQQSTFPFLRGHRLDLQRLDLCLRTKGESKFRRKGPKGGVFGAPKKKSLPAPPKSPLIAAILK